MTDSQHWNQDLPTAPPTGSQASSYAATTWAPPDPPPPFPAPSHSPSSPRLRSGGGWRPVVAVIAILALVAGGVLVGRLTSDSAATTSSAGSSTASKQSSGLSTTPPVKGSDEEPVAAVASAVAPAVVQIKTSEGLGSGVVYDKSGLVMTNAHVVGTSTQVQVQTSDGSTVNGDVVGSDTATDIAVVKIDPKAVQGVAALAVDENVRVGQLAVAIGSPFGLDHTVTAGIVSAVGRPFDESAQTNSSGQSTGSSSGVVVPMIQTDAPINPGNSGGALADRHGRVIGINTAIYSQSGENSGVGFAIPIALAYSRAEKLAQGQQVSTPFLGIGGDSPADGSAGALVTTVENGSSAEKAGLRQGDVVVAMDGKSVASFLDLAASIGAHQPGDTVKFEVVRDGKHIELTATLGSR